MTYTTVGKIISLSPLQCKLKGGFIYTVKNATLLPLRKEVQDLFRHEF
jgi:hypothetical protein